MEDASSSNRESKAFDNSEAESIARPAIVSFSTDRSSAFCSYCCEIVELLTIVKGAFEYNTDIQDIQFLLSQDEIHAVPNDPGIIMLCSASLATCFERRKTRLLDSHFELESRGSIQENRDD